MSFRAALIASWVCAFAALGIGVAFYRTLPNLMVTHWGVHGSPNGYLGKQLAVALIPAIIAGASTLLLFLPLLDPLRENIKSFQAQYYSFIVFLAGILAVIQSALIAVNLGAAFNIALVVMPAVGLIFFAVGLMLPNTKRNFLIGVRTPWTILSDEVWDRTNRLAGRLFMALGAIAFLSLSAPAYAFFIFIAPTIIVVVGLVVYSFMAYREVTQHY